MLKTRIKRQAVQTERAIARLHAVQSSVTALGNEDLLDLADIFSTQADTPLAEMASAEMLKRNISL